MFIVFEGPEGGGKTTQIRYLQSRLVADGYTVVATREPGGTALGERLRDILLHGTLTPSAIAEAYLMTAARAEHVRVVIRPALERGDIVLCDRFSDSTLAYQGAGRGIDLEDLRDLQRLAVGDCLPDLKLLLDLDVETGLHRRISDGDANRLDRETLSFHRRVADWYRSEALSNPSVWEIVDAGQNENAVALGIADVITERMRKREDVEMAGLIR